MILCAGCPLYPALGNQMYAYVGVKLPRRVQERGSCIDRVIGILFTGVTSLPAAGWKAHSHVEYLHPADSFYFHRSVMVSHAKVKGETAVFSYLSRALRFCFVMNCRKTAHSRHSTYCRTARLWQSASVSSARQRKRWLRCSKCTTRYVSWHIC